MAVYWGALGASVEFLSRAEILVRFGSEGITDYAPIYGGLGRITDDTQMTLLTAEGLLRGWVRGAIKGITTYPGVTAHAYLRWLQTQGEEPQHDIMIGPNPFGWEPGWLIQQRALHDRRAPGHTCLSALREMPSLGALARNNSKGCGGVMRVAPVGLFWVAFPTRPSLGRRVSSGRRSGGIDPWPSHGTTDGWNLGHPRPEPDRWSDPDRGSGSRKSLPATGTAS
ncbi:hypothetical protein GCM10027040_21070 [Halomonas shantousis]